MVWARVENMWGSTTRASQNFLCLWEDPRRAENRHRAPHFLPIPEYAIYPMTLCIWWLILLDRYWVFDATLMLLLAHNFLSIKKKKKKELWKLFKTYQGSSSSRQTPLQADHRGEWPLGGKELLPAYPLCLLPGDSKWQTEVTNTGSMIGGSSPGASDHEV